MYIGCVDCTRPITDENKSERPTRVRKDGNSWNYTITCCKSCVKKWMLAHPEIKKMRARVRTMR
jgi:hypothetical protein